MFDFDVSSHRPKTRRSSLSWLPMRPTRSETYFAAVQDELNEERAAALGRTGRRIEAALARCVRLAAELEAEHCAERRQALTDEYRAACDDCQRWRWTLCVQREALGLNEHSWVDRVYPTPPRVDTIVW